MLASGEKTPVVFTADWCSLCRSFESIFDGAQSPYAHYAVKVNEDESPLWDRFDIKAVPTLAAFQDGKMVARRDLRLGVGLGKGDMGSILKEL